MTLKVINPTDLEEARSLSHEGSSAAVQFEAIIRAWKGETIDPEGTMPVSPVGAADMDGSLSAEQMFFPTATMGSLLFCTDICSYLCPTQLWLPSCNPQNCQYG